jgi:NhaA family Na+:H+ antiporter
MATDIAFSLAVLGLLGGRIPLGIKIFLTAVAIADDIGAVIVIAVFYTSSIDWTYVGAGAVVLLLFGAANLLWIRHVLVYALLAVVLWLCVLASGVHATIAGVLAAFFVPARGKYNIDVFIDKVSSHLEPMIHEGSPRKNAILLNKTHLNAVHSIDLACREVETPLQRIEHTLELWIALIVLPLFALANAGLNLRGLDVGSALAHPVTAGIALGLVLGKPVGISLFTFLSVRLLGTPLMQGISWRQVIGVSFLAGIGFTMSLFINGLSFSDPKLLENAKLGIILASVVAAAVGSFLLAVPSAGAENRESGPDEKPQRAP